MRIFQTFEAVPSRVIGLLQVLRRQPGPWVDRATMLDLMQPSSIRTGQNAGTTIDVIAAAVELGAVLEDRTDKAAPKLRLADTLVFDDDRAFEACLPHLLARAALTRECQGRPNQFTRACAWLLLQNPVAMPQGHAELKTRAEEDSLDLDELGLRNDQRWDNLVYWSTYLGLTWQTTERKCVGVIPDPSTYLLRHLDEVLPTGEAVPVHQFRDQLGALCPALDGGSVYREIAARLVSAGVLVARVDERLSAALSFSLRHLKASGQVDYWCPDDQRTFLLMSDDEKVAFVRRRAGGTA